MKKKTIIVLLFLFSCFFVFNSSGYETFECLETELIPVPGAGATFPQVAYTEWMFTYELTSAGDESDICYYACGSGCGKSCIINGYDSGGQPCEVTFGASDSLLSESDYEKVPDLQMFPMLGGSVVPMYNLGSIQNGELVLGREVLAEIFMCEITHWRDPKIVELNSGPNQLCPGGNVNSTNCHLPNQKIQVYHRSDSSGTTETFTKALYSFSQKWRDEAGEPSSNWPKSIHDKCNQGESDGNYGTFALVLSQPYSITYVSYGILKNTGTGQYARILNKDGYIVDGTKKYVQNAMTKTEWNESRFTGECIDVSGESWPISAYTYIIFRKNQTDDNPSWSDCDSVREAIDFFKWTLSDEIAISRADDLGFVPLEPNLANSVISRMESSIFCNERPAVITYRFPVGVLVPETTTKGGLEFTNEDISEFKEMIEYTSKKLETSTFSSNTTEGLKGWELQLFFEDSMNSQSEALVLTSSLIEKNVKVMMAEVSDLLTDTIQILAQRDSICQMTAVTDESQGNTEPDLSLIRLSPTFLEQSEGIFSLIEELGWNQIILLSSQERDSLTLSGYIYDSSSSLSYEINTVRVTLNVSQIDSSEKVFEKIINSGIRVIVSCLSKEEVEPVVEKFYEKGLIGNGYTWIFALTKTETFNTNEKGINVGQRPEVQNALRGAMYFSLGSEEGKSMYQNLMNEIKQQQQELNEKYPQLVAKAISGEPLNEVSVTYYDLVMSLGWGIDDIIKDMDSFQIQQHDFHDLTTVIKEKVNFQGLTGMISFDSNGNRLGEYVLMNYQTDVSKPSSSSSSKETTTTETGTGTKNQNMSWKSVGKYSNQNSNLEVDEQSIQISGGTWSSPPPDYVPPKDEVVRFEWDDPLTITGIVLTIFGELLVLWFLVETFHFEQRKIIRAASIFFLRLVLLGISIGYVGNLLILFPPSVTVCILYPWLCWVGFTFVFGGLYSKTYRIWRIFFNPDLKNISLTNGKVFQSTLAAFSVNGLIILLWQVIDTPYVTESAKYYKDGKVAEMCTSPNEDIWGALYLVPFFALLFGLSVVSFLTRNIQSKLNESRHIALAIYHFAVCFLISVVISISLREFLEFQAMIRFIGVYIGISGLMFILYIPKFWVCYLDVSASNTLELSTSKNNSVGNSINSNQHSNQISNHHSNSK